MCVCLLFLRVVHNKIKTLQNFLIVFRRLIRNNGHVKKLLKKLLHLFLWANVVNIWQPLSGSYSQRMLSVFPPAAQNKLLSIPLAALADCSMKCFPNVYTRCVNRRRPFIASEVAVTFSMNAPEEVMNNIY